MNDSTNNNPTTRREFLKTTGQFAAVSALAGVTLPHVHAAESNTIQVALIGCGGRGTGAAANALSVNNGPIKLVAMADVFGDKLKGSHDALKKNYADKMEVPEDHKFIGFDGYKKAMDCLKPGDIAIFTTPPAFRWPHFQYAIEKNLNVFMEKPVTVDGPTSKKMFALGEESVKKNLKVGVGLMCRHCRSRQELFKRVQDGQAGEILMLRGYRMHGPQAECFSPPKPANIDELEYQIRRFHGWMWASGGLYSDFFIHNIDECCWIKNAWPVKAQSNGGRHYRGTDIDQNFDTYTTEFTFADGTKMFFYGRNISGCNDKFSSQAHGSKGLAIISDSGHAPSKARIYKGQDPSNRANLVWSAKPPEPNPYQLEWDDLIDAIRNDKPFNEVKRGVEASLVCTMGRMAAHTGQEISWDDALNCEHEFAPNVDKLVIGGPAPILADADGKYPIPQPGIVKHREF